MKVIFLDIDGVLQPFGSQERYNHKDEIKELCKRLHDEHPWFDYEKYTSVKSMYYRCTAILGVYYVG